MTAAPEIVAVNPTDPEPGVIARAVAVIRAGGLVGMPTETVYGLAANALEPKAIARIFAAKGRPSHNPLIAHVARADDARALAAEWPTMARELAARFWPGPLTLIVRRKAMVPSVLAAGLDTFGVRVPDHPVALALIRAAGVPLAAPSANKFTEVSPVTASQVARGLGDAVDLILDAGRCRVGIESTVVDVSGGTPVVLRPGMITRAEIEAVVGPTGRSSTPVLGTAPRPAPGMIDRHYAPKATVRIVEAEELTAAVRHAIDRTTDAALVGLLLHSRAPSTSENALGFVQRLGTTAAAFGAELYHALHAADAAGCRELVVEAVPVDPEWDAIRDRLIRAAHSD